MSGPRYTFCRLDRGQIGEARLALQDAGLPSDDIDEESTTVYRLDDGAGPIGWAALERHGDEALLRSVVVPAHRRGTGAGTDLVREVLTAAAAGSVRRVWLLTETAAPFFSGLGFETTDRDRAPEAIRRTSEFAGICPASAACMMLALAQP